jgi:hypothetical protein
MQRIRGESDNATKSGIRKRIEDTRSVKDKRNRKKAAYALAEETVV